MRGLRAAVMAVAVIGLVVSLWSGADAGAVHDAGLFTTVLDRNDDGSVGPVAIGFDINFFGLNGGNQATLFVNNNGNVTFTGALNTFTPFNLITTGTPMIAPFFADVDTRNLGSDVVRYGQSSIGGQSVFGVNWIGVGYFFQSATHLNSFQLIITNRSDTGPGNFDFEFNYDTITWETGTAASSGGDSDGLGGNSARAGWSNGSTDNFELAGSAINGALLDSNCDAGGSTGLICNSRNSDVLGQYIFSVRNGQVEEPPSEVPLPGTLILLGAGLLGLGTTAAVRRRSK